MASPTCAARFPTEIFPEAFIGWGGQSHQEPLVTGMQKAPVIATAYQHVSPGERTAMNQAALERLFASSVWTQRQRPMDQPHL